jgi:hypothetical protein
MDLKKKGQGGGEKVKKDEDDLESKIVRKKAFKKIL